MKARHGRVTRIRYPDGSGVRVIATVRVTGHRRAWMHQPAHIDHTATGPHSWDIRGCTRADAMAEHGLDRLIVRRWAHASAGPARTTPGVRYWHRR